MSSRSADFEKPLGSWKVTDLREELKRRSLPTKGIKDDLIKRLQEALRNESEENNTEGDGGKDKHSECDLTMQEIVVEDDEADVSEEGISVQNTESITTEDVKPVPGQGSDTVVHTSKGAANSSKNEDERKDANEKSASDKPDVVLSSSPKPSECHPQEEKQQATVASLISEPSEKQMDENPNSESSNQVSEKVISTDVGFQKKCESVSTDSVSLNEENELKDSLNADNVNLESDIFENRNLQESSRYVSQQQPVGALDPTEPQIEAAVDDHLRDSQDLGENIADKRNVQSPAEGDVAVDTEKSVDLSHIKEEHAKKSLNDAPRSDESESKNDLDEIPVVKSLREDDISDAVAIDICQDVKETEKDVPAIASAGDKRKSEGQETPVEPVKRQRRWNSGNNQALAKDFQVQVNALATMSPSAPTLHKSASSRFSGKSDASNNGDDQRQRVVPPSPRTPTTSLRIDKFVRPFTLKAVQELLGKTGKVTAFWMDHIKTHCYVVYSSVEEAIATRDAVYNLQWPSNGGQNLVAEFVDPEEAKRKIEEPNALPKASQAPAPTRSTGFSHGQQPLKPAAATHGIPVPRQHNLPVPSTSSSILPQPPIHRERMPMPPPPKKVEPPAVTLDDLFKKTKASPRIYYLPLSEEEVAAKLARSRTRGT